MRPDHPTLLSEFVANASPMFRCPFVERKAGESLAKLGDDCEIRRAMGRPALMSAVDKLGQHDRAEGNAGWVRLA